MRISAHNGTSPALSATPRKDGERAHSPRMGSANSSHAVHSACRSERPFCCSVICSRPGPANRMADNLRLAMAGVTYEVIDSSDGVRIVLHHLGGPSGKETTPVLLFSHATGFHGRVWEPMASHLTDQ